MLYYVGYHYFGQLPPSCSIGIYHSGCGNTFDAEPLIDMVKEVTGICILCRIRIAGDKQSLLLRNAIAEIPQPNLFFVIETFLGI